MRISASRSRGCSLPPLHRSKSHQTAPLNSAPRSPTISSRSGEIAPRSHKFKIPLHPNTCRFQPKPYAWDTLPCVADVERVCCVTAAEKKSASLLFCRGATVACGWTAPDTRVFRRQCGCSNLLTYIGTERKTNTQQNRSATRSLYPIKNSQQQQHQLSRLH